MEAMVARNPPLKSFRYWQQAPSQKMFPLLANPGNAAMSAHMEGEAGNITLINQREKIKGGRGMPPVMRVLLWGISSA